MNKTQIEWAKNPDGSQGYTWNPITGCLNHTDGLCKGGNFPCYAYKLANGRLKPLYLANNNIAMKPLGNEGALGYRYDRDDFKDPFYPRFWEERLEELTKRNDLLYYDGLSTVWKNRLHPRGIFVCDMGDLFGAGVPEEWTEKVLDEIWGNKGYDRFYLLTKQPRNLIKWSPFPENCWVGVTATNGKMVDDAGYWLQRIDAKVKFLSLEPLLEPMLLFFGKPTLDWIIIGACTGTREEVIDLFARYPALNPMPWGKKFTLQPKIEWVQEIVEAADKAGIRVFFKDNLMPLFKRGDIWAIPEWAGFQDWTKQEIGTTLR